MKFPGDQNLAKQTAAKCYYVCQKCGGIITDRHKPQMLREGQWRAVESKTQLVKKVAFWMNTLYSPFVRFSEVVNEFLDSKDDPEKLQNFVNSWLAEPWEDTKLKTSADLVLERQTDLPEYHGSDVGQVAHRRRGRAGELPLLDDQSVGRFHHLAEHRPRSGFQLCRGRTGDEPAIPPAGRQPSDGG